MRWPQDLAGLWRVQREVVADVARVLRGPERRAVRLALVIAVIDQAMASTAIVNYAPQARARSRCCLHLSLERHDKKHRLCA
jgi:hypothetical protein